MSSSNYLCFGYIYVYMLIIDLGIANLLMLMKIDSVNTNEDWFCLILMKIDSQLYIWMHFQLCLNVQVGEERRAIQVQVREDAPVITVIFRTSDQIRLPATVHSTLFEVSEHLNMGKDSNTYCTYM